MLGGGAIGAELTPGFARFGVTGTLIEAVDRLLPGDEPEAGRMIADVLRRDGVQVLSGVSASKVSHDVGGFTLDLANGGDGRTAQGCRALTRSSSRSLVRVVHSTVG